MFACHQWNHISHRCVGSLEILLVPTKGNTEPEEKSIKQRDKNSAGDNRVSFSSQAKKMANIALSAKKMVHTGMDVYECDTCQKYTVQVFV